jgi:hypothetical protein
MRPIQPNGGWKCHINKAANRSVFLAGVFLFVSIFAGTNSPAAATDEDIAVSLATLLRASRAVISKIQKHINNPAVGHKGLRGQLETS